jgi:serine/threonine protein kinase
MIDTNTILQDRYRILRTLGRGGMGAVYEAIDIRLSRTVALKETLVDTDELRRAFEREAFLLANLRHPTLPKVLDHFSEGTGLFLVMEYIPGDDLGVMLEIEGRSFAPADVLLWADQLLDALGYLHRLDPPVLHRDIKPSNLKLVSESHIILLDFGLAKGSAGQMTRTDSKSLLGYSPNYSPLEQMQGTGTDERSDLYSLGATLYHLFTGVKPPNALSRATAVIGGQPDPLLPADSINHEVAPSVSAALMRAMALNIVNRPRTASDMRDELHNVTLRASETVPMMAENENTRVRLPVYHSEVAASDISSRRAQGRQVVVPVPEETWVARKQRGGRRTWVLGIILIAGLATLSAALYLLFSVNEKPRSTLATQAVVVNSPSPSPIPTPSPSPVANTNQPANINSSPAPGPDELSARAKLAEKGIPYNEATFTGAVEHGDTGAVDLFLVAGISPDVRDATGKTALVNAASRGSNNISQKLLRKGADVNAKDVTGSTALMESARGGHKETTKVLLDYGADVNLTDNKGQTALIRAAAQGHKDIVRMLINKGARVDVKGKDGRDALMWAEINDKSDVIDLLRKAGAAKR